MHFLALPPLPQQCCGIPRVAELLSMSFTLFFEQPKPTISSRGARESAARGRDLWVNANTPCRGLHPPFLQPAPPSCRRRLFPGRPSRCRRRVSWPLWSKEGSAITPTQLPMISAGRVAVGGAPAAISSPYTPRRPPSSPSFLSPAPPAQLWPPGHLPCVLGWALRTFPQETRPFFVI